MSQLISGNQSVHIDEDELLEELEALKEQDKVLNDGEIRIDGEIVKLPSVPSVQILHRKSESESEGIDDIEASSEATKKVAILE